MEIETVELIMAVEEEFGIEIPDEVAERVISVGQLSTVVQTEMSRLHRGQDEQAVFDRVAGIAAHFGGGVVVRPDTRLIEDLGLK
jgi:hypothetical protein